MRETIGKLVGALGGVSPLVQHSAMVLLLGYFGYQQELMGEEIKQLKLDNHALYAKIVRLEEDKRTMLAQMNRADPNSDMHDFIRTSDAPEWLQSVTLEDNGKPSFTMAIISEKYERTYGVSLRAYQGKTDFEVWREPGIAQIMYDNNMQAFKTREKSCYIVSYPTRAYALVSKNNPLLNWKVCKRPVSYFGKLAIASRARLATPADIEQFGDS